MQKNVEIKTSNKINIFSENNVLIATCFIMFLVYFQNWGDISTIMATHDEFGYISNAAFLAGFGWAENMIAMPYYSAGYSLLLIPLFYIFEYGDAFISATHLINIVLTLLAFVINYKTAKKLFGSVKDNVIDLKLLIPCIIASFSFGIPIYITQVWGEVLLNFLFSLSIWLIVSIFEKPNYLKIIILALIYGYMYTVHMRTLPIIFCMVLGMVLLYKLKKVSIYNLLVFCAIIIACFAATELLNSYLKSNLYYQNSGAGQANTYSSFASGLLSINLDTFKNFVVIGLGQIYNLGLGTFFMGYYFVYKTVKIIINCIKTKTLKLFDFVSIYIFLSLLGMIALTLFFFYDSELRLDFVFYTRYSASIYVLVLIIGFAQFVQDIRRNKNLLLKLGVAFSVISFVSATIIGLILSTYEKLGNYNIITAPSTISLVWLTENEYSTLIFILVPIVIWWLIYLSTLFSKYNFLQYIVLLIVALFLLSNNNLGIHGTVRKSDGFKQVHFDILNNSDSQTDYYYITYPEEDKVSIQYNIFDAQSFLLKDTVHVISSGEANIKNGDFIFAEKELPFIFENSNNENQYVLVESAYNNYHYTYQAFSFDNAGLNYTLGEEIGVTTPLETLSTYVGAGVYFDNEENHAWTIGDELTAAFYVGEQSQDVYIDIYVQSVFNDSQQVVAKIGEKVLFDKTLINPGTISVLVDKDLLNDGMLFLNMEFPDAVSPSELGKSTDTNEYAIDIASFSISGIVQRENYLVDSLIMDFADDESAKFFGLQNWNLPEDGVCWTTEASSFEFLLEDTDKDIIMDIKSSASLSNGDSDILLNGKKVATLAPHVNMSHQVTLPSEFLADNGMQTITIETPGAKSPEELGLSDDTRVLGVLVNHIKLTTYDGVTTVNLDAPTSFNMVNWNLHEGESIWTTDKSSFDVLIPATDEDLVMRLDVQGYSMADSSEIYVNGQKIYTFEHNDIFNHDIVIPADVLSDTGVQTITIETPDAKSPKESGVSDDDRILGISVKNIEIERDVT